MSLDFNLSPTCAARVVVQSRDGKGWTLGDLARLVAVLELQRSFLAGEPLNVEVRVSTPPPANPQSAPAQRPASIPPKDAASMIAEVIR
jgi:hypothetical protein